MATIARLYVDLISRTQGFDGPLKKSGRTIERFGIVSDTVAAKVMRFGDGLTRLIGITGGLSLGAALGIGAKMAVDFETAETSLRVMLGSAVKARKTLGELQDFAASTPFRLPELQTSAKSLIAFGSASEQVTSELRKIGDIAAGVGTPIGELATIYGKARVNGRLMAEDVNQLTERGIPIIGAFARQFGVAESEVRRLVTQGKIGFPQLERAFRDLTARGGQFNGMMGQQSQTIGGLVSTLQDNVGMVLKDLATELFRTLDVRKVLADATQWVTKVGKEVIHVTTAVGRWVRDNAALAKSIASVAAVTTAGLLILPKIVSGVEAIRKVWKAATAAKLAYFAVDQGADLIPSIGGHGKSKGPIRVAASAVEDSQAVLLRQATRNSPEWLMEQNRLMREAATSGGLFRGSLGRLAGGLRSLLPLLGKAKAGLLLLGKGLGLVVAPAYLLGQAFRALHRTLFDGGNFFSNYNAVLEETGSKITQFLGLNSAIEAAFGFWNGQHAGGVIAYAAAVEQSNKALRYQRQQLEHQAEVAKSAGKPFADQIKAHQEVEQALKKEIDERKKLIEAAKQQPVALASELRAMKTLEQKLADTTGAIKRLERGKVATAAQSVIDEREAAATEAFTKQMRDLQGQIERIGRGDGFAAFADGIDKGFSPEQAHKVAAMTIALKEAKAAQEAFDELEGLRRANARAGMSEIDVKVEAFAEKIDNQPYIQRRRLIREYQTELNRESNIKLRTDMLDAAANDVRNLRRDLGLLERGRITVELDELRTAGASMQELKRHRDDLAKSIVLKVKMDTGSELERLKRELAELQGQGIEYQIAELRRDGLNVSELDQVRSQLEEIEKLKKRVAHENATIQLRTTIDDLQLKLKHFGNDAGLEDARLARQGLPPDMIEQYRRFADQLQNKESAAAIVERNITPLERAGREYEKARELFDAGELSDDHFAREAKRIREGLKGDAPAMDKSPSLVDLSTGEGQAALVRMQQQRGGVQDKQLAEQRTGNRLLGDLISAVERRTTRPERPEF